MEGKKPTKLKTVKPKTVKDKIKDGICSAMTGKMEGMQSFSTPCSHNPFCQKNQKIEGSICQKCYAEQMMAMYDNLDAKCLRNAEVVTEVELTPEDVPEINVKYFRFEAFGDLMNELQLRNYVMIAQCNPDTQFALWTKNYKIALDYFSAHKCPENMNVLFSSLFVNKQMSVEPLLATGAFSRPGQCKVFTVYTKEYLQEHPEIKINCGSKLCLSCKQCYNKTTCVYINEILKSDQKAAEKMITMRDPEKKQAYLDKYFSKF